MRKSKRTKNNKKNKAPSSSKRKEERYVSIDGHSFNHHFHKVVDDYLHSIGVHHVPGFSLSEITTIDFVVERKNQTSYF